MSPKYLLTIICSFGFLTVFAQQQRSLVAGPMLGHTELRTAIVWAQFGTTIRTASIFLKDKTKPSEKKLAGTLQLSGGAFNTGVFRLTALEPGKSYRYYIKVGNERVFADSGDVTTQEFWHWRKPAPEFSFIAGSCAHFNEPAYDRPGKPYGGDSSIFLTMAKEKSAFMLWLGDNWYTREADFYSDWGLYYRASRDRSFPVLQPLLKSMSQYAIWDDHDYGPNDADKGYVLKETSRQVFSKYWANPSCGMNGQGIHSKFTWNDVDFFLLDDRWFRSNDKMPDSVDGKPNVTKKMFGDEQMEWLKNGLMQSAGNTNISFRVIVTGSQVLNPFSPRDCLRHYPTEYNELTNFIADNKINGIFFITGDRHHSEIIKAEREGGYPLYDITASPLTSGISKTSGAETKNAARISKEIDEQNYARIRFSGEGKDRQLEVHFIGIKGAVLDSWSVRLRDLSY
jgi:alkaline phosphatase D